MTEVVYKEKRQPQTAFVVAILIYALGIFLFSSWSYRRQAAFLQTRFDDNVANATYACREIIGTGRARQHIHNGETNAPVYLQHQERFDRFSEKSGLELLAVATSSPSNAYYLIASEPGKSIKTIQYGMPLPDYLIKIMGDPGDTNAAPGGSASVAYCDQGNRRMALLRIQDDTEPDFLFVAAANYAALDSHLSRLAAKKTMEATFLLLMAIPLILFHNKTQHQVRQQLETLNEQLKKEIQNQADREDELRDAIVDLERFNALSVGRESRIIELKGEINELLEKLGEKKRYNIDGMD